MNIVKKVKEGIYIYNTGKILSLQEGLNELLKIYFVANEEQKQKLIKIFDKELF